MQKHMSRPHWFHRGCLYRTKKAFIPTRHQEYWRQILKYFVCQTACIKAEIF